jgi:hypothetical protein
MGSDLNVDWIHVDQNAVKWEILVSTVMYLRAPQSVGNFQTIICSRKIQQLCVISWVLISNSEI